MGAQRLKVEVVWVVRSVPDLCFPIGVAHSTLPRPSPTHRRTHPLNQSPGRSSPSLSFAKRKNSIRVPGPYMLLLSFAIREVLPPLCALSPPFLPPLHSCLFYGDLVGEPHSLLPTS